MHWKIYDETVDMVDCRFQYMPQVFHWRGQRYDVDVVERSWTVAGRGWAKLASARVLPLRRMAPAWR